MPISCPWINSTICSRGGAKEERIDHVCFVKQSLPEWSFPGGSVVKNLPANAGDTGLTPVSGRSPGEGNGTHSSILAWIIPWTEEPGKPQSMGLQRNGHDLATKQQHFQSPAWCHGTKKWNHAQKIIKAYIKNFLCADLAHCKDVAMWQHSYAFLHLFNLFLKEF